MTAIDNKPSIVILISGRGSNMESIVNAMNSGSLDVCIATVISNRPDAAGIIFAKQQGIKISVIDHKKFKTAEQFDRALLNEIDQFSPDLVVLAGFMRILTYDFVKYFAGRLINIHPSLLPKFKGLNTHQRAIDAGEKVHGASVHFVTNELDGGSVIMQTHIPILVNDDTATLAARVLKQEHKLYPNAINKLIGSSSYTGTNNA